MKQNYSNVTLHLDSRVWRSLKRMAVRENTPITALCNEAIATWLKWLAKVAMEEAKIEEKEAWAQEWENAKQLVTQLRQRTARRNKLLGGKKTRAAWHRKYPHKPWPWPGLKEWPDPDGQTWPELRQRERKKRRKKVVEPENKED